MLNQPGNRRLSPRELARRKAEIAAFGVEGWRQRQFERSRREEPILPKLLKAIAETAGRVKNAVFGPPTAFRPDRRAFLKVVIENAPMAAAISIPTIGVVSKLLSDAADRREVQRRVDQVLAEPGDVEALPKGALIPEDERSGSDIMIGLNPENSMIPFYGYKLDAALDESPGPILAALEAGTTAHVTVPTGTKEEFLELAKERYPALNFVVYEMPVNPTVGYMQDILFATGSRNDGRFILASSTLDATEFKNLPHYEPPTVPTINLPRIRNILVDGNEVIQATAGINLLGDEILVRDNPASFKAHMVPVKLEGGDVDAIRLPNGEVGLMVGPWSVISNIVNLANKEAGRKKYSANDIDGFSKIPRDVFVRLLRKLEEDYRKFLGVSKVIFVDEANFLSLAEQYDDIPLEALFPQKFFHTDMAVKVATDGSGKPIAFCTGCNSPMGIDYLQRVKAQFLDLGYEIVDLPCGPFPVMNYTNGLMYTKNGEKVVVMPTYGIDEDEVAARIYQKRGFRVVKVDLSSIKDFDPGRLDNLGSVHCRAEILA